MGQRKNKNSTSPESEYVPPVTLGRELTFDHIGTSVAVYGKDITLTAHAGMSKTVVGVLYSLRMTADRITVTLDVKHTRLPFRSPRVIEVEV